MLVYSVLLIRSIYIYVKYYFYYDLTYKEPIKSQQKNKKALQQKAKKGLEMSSSPYWTRSELFVGGKL